MAPAPKLERPSVAAHCNQSGALPILAELRYTRLAGVDYSMYHQIWALLAGVELVHRWRAVGVGARLLLGVSGDLAYRWDYESTWHSGSPTPDQDRAEARLDFSVHFNRWSSAQEVTAPPTGAKLLM